MNHPEALNVALSVRGNRRARGVEGKRWLFGACALVVGTAGCAKTEDDVGDRITAVEGAHGEQTTGKPVGHGDSAGVEPSGTATTSPHDDPGVDGNGTAGDVAVTTAGPDHSSGAATNGAEQTFELPETDGETALGGETTGGKDTRPAQACGARAGATCGQDEYCAYEAGQYCGAADAEAVCKRIPTACTREYAPVCGCDGVTYSNACGAAAAGTGVMDDGECPTPSDCDQVQCLRAVNCATSCDGDIVQSGCCPCPEGLVDVEVECVACGGFADPSCDPHTEYCAYEAGKGACGVLDASAVCKPRPAVCTQEVDPVCGCDGKTYSNECAANAAGTGISSNGACED